MTLDPDIVVDRRRMRRRLSLWRLLALGLVAAGIAAALFWSAGERAFSRYGDHVARFEIDGFIAGDRRTLDRLDDLAEAEGARAVIVEIDSPGGTTAGAEALYDALRRLGEDKPVVAMVDTLAASGGYIAALGAERIFVRGNSLVGSIGVLMQWPEAGALLERLGIDIHEVKSTELKAEPNYFEPPSEEAEAMLRAVVDDTYRWFTALVAQRRGLDAGAVETLADGRIMTGRQAVETRLADALGGEREIRAWLEAQHGIAADLPLREWKPREQGWTGGLASRVASGLAESAGLGGLARALERSAPLSVDGLISVWQPPSSRASGGGRDQQ